MHYHNKKSFNQALYPPYDPLSLVLGMVRVNPKDGKSRVERLNRLGEPEEVEVVTGKVTLDDVEVEHGLTPGDVIVLAEH